MRGTNVEHAVHELALLALRIDALVEEVVLQLCVRQGADNRSVISPWSSPQKQHKHAHTRAHRTRHSPWTDSWESSILDMAKVTGLVKAAATPGPLTNFGRGGGQ